MDYTHTVGGFAVKMPFHPDDVLTALGVLRIYLPADGTTAAAQSRIDDAFVRALLTLTEQGRRRYERDELEPQYRYERERENFGSKYFEHLRRRGWIKDIKEAAK